MWLFVSGSEIGASEELLSRGSLTLYSAAGCASNAFSNNVFQAPPILLSSPGIVMHKGLVSATVIDFGIHLPV